MADPNEKFPVGPVLTRSDIAARINNHLESNLFRDDELLNEDDDRLTTELCREFADGVYMAQASTTSMGAENQQMFDLMVDICHRLGFAVPSAQ